MRICANSVAAVGCINHSAFNLQASVNEICQTQTVSTCAHMKFSSFHLRKIIKKNPRHGFVFFQLANFIRNLSFVRQVPFSFSDFRFCFNYDRSATYMPDSNTIFQLVAQRRVGYECIYKYVSNLMRFKCVHDENINCLNLNDHHS